MADTLRFHSEDELKEIETAEKVKAGGGIIYETIPDEETGEQKNYINVFGTRVETYATEQEVKELKDELILSPLDQRLLRRIADSYNLKQALLFEGDPGAGKTFLFKRFVKFVHGKDAPILEIVGTPRTSELEIFGHWSPKGATDKEEQEYEELLQQFLLSNEGKKGSEEFDSQLEELNRRFTEKTISESEFRDEFGRLTTEHISQQRSELVAFCRATQAMKPDVQWEFKEGALLRAYSGNDGKGYPLIVDEFNIIPSNYQQIFLQIGGESGSLAESISFWGNAGKTIYRRGKDTWVAFASNFPEKTPGRSEVVAPMSDRLVWQVLPDEEYQEKKQAIKRTAGGRLQQRKKGLVDATSKSLSVPVESGIQWDKVLNEQLGEQVADLVDLIDTEFTKYYSQVGDSLKIHGDNRRRTQQMEFSGRNALRLFSYLDHFQVRDKETGRVDMIQTVRNAFEMYYVNRLASAEAREKMRKLFDEIVTGDTGKIEVALDLSFREKVERIARHKPIEKEPKTRKEVIDNLVSQIDREEAERRTGGIERMVISGDGPTKTLLEQVIVKLNEASGGRKLTDAEYADNLQHVIDSMFDSVSYEGRYATIRDSIKDAFKKIFSSNGNTVVLNIGDGKGEVSGEMAVVAGDLMALQGETKIKVIPHLSNVGLGKDNPIGTVLDMISSTEGSPFELVKLVEPKLLDDDTTQTFKEKVFGAVGLPDRISITQRRQDVLDTLISSIIDPEYKEQVKELIKNATELKGIPKDSGNRLIVLADGGHFEAALRQVVGVFLDHDAVIVDMDATKWNGDSDRSTFLRRPTSSQKITRLSNLAEAVDKEPILLLSFVDEAQIRKADPKLDAILNRPNVRFVRQPMELVDVLKFLQGNKETEK